MNTKRLTEAAMLSAALVIMSIVAITTGVAYSIYLDILVPIIISIIFLRIDFKYTALSSITSCLIVILAIGDIVSGIWMTQGIIIGLICGYFILKKGTVFDDFFYSCILGCFVMVLVDIYLSTITGYSFMKEFETYANIMSFDNELMERAYYIFVATIPSGTILLVYLGTLLIGKRLNILNDNCKSKYNVIWNFKRYGGYLCCSAKTYTLGVGYLILFQVLQGVVIKLNYTYLTTVTMSIEVVILYFVIKDSYSFVNKFIYIKSKSKNTAKSISFVILYLLITNFRATTIILIATSIVINVLTNLRENQLETLNRYLEPIK